MSKPKLNLQQQKRIHTQQARKLEINDPSSQYKGLVISHHGAKVIVEPVDLNNTKLPSIITCYCRKNLESIATGDQVIWQTQENDENGVIIARLPRTSILSRPALHSKQNKEIAANISQIFIVMALEPDPVGHYIDRYLVAAEHQSIKPILLFNKTDLLNKKNEGRYTSLTQRYQQLGYEVIGLSALNLDKDSSLQNKLQNNVSVFVGQSGVGKSEIIQALLPKEYIKTGNISDSTKRGKHTTTTAKLYHLTTGGMLIDSPGIREFGLWDLPKEAILGGFVELRSFRGLCKFRDCNHLENTPGCAIVEALAKEEIHPQRFKNYHRIMSEYTQN